MLRWKSSLKPAASGDDNPGTTNLVNDWSMDETSGTRADSHGSADLTDNNTVTSATGVISNAASFNPANSEYLSSSTQPVTGTVARATECWFKTSYSGTDSQCITDYGAGSTGERWRIGIDDGGLVALRVFGATKIWDSSWNDGNWHHLVMQVAASSECDDVEVYVDGTLDTSASGASATVSIDTGTGSQRIGIRSNTTRGFNGQIDEFRNWNRVLTSAEITWLYNGGSGRSYSAVSGGTGGLSTPTLLGVRNPTSTGRTSTSINISSATEGALLLATVTARSIQTSLSAPTEGGWTLLSSVDNGSSSSRPLNAVYYKTASASESTVTWTHSSEFTSAIAIEIDGADTSTIAVTSNQSSWVLGVVTVPTNGIVIAVHAKGSSSSTSASSFEYSDNTTNTDYTMLGDAYGTTRSGTAVGWADLGSGDTNGTDHIRGAGSGASSATHHIAIKPA